MTLVEALDWFVNKFNRVFHRQNMFSPRPVDQVDHRSKVVVLPEPVGPVTKISPLGFSVIS